MTRMVVLLLLAMLLAIIRSLSLSLSNAFVVQFCCFPCIGAEVNSLLFTLGWCCHHRQWWCSSIGAGEWGEGTSTRVAIDCKDQRICWCSSGTIQNMVHIWLAGGWGEGTSTRVAIACKDQRICWCNSGTIWLGFRLNKFVWAGTWIIHNCTGPCNTKSYFKCWFGGFSNWLFWNKWSLVSKNSLFYRS